MSAIVSEKALQRLQANGQEHLLRHAASLSADELAALEAQLSTIDLANVNALYRSTYVEASAAHGKISPPPQGSITRLASAAAEVRAGWLSLGLGAISRSEVAAVVLSGGQGTRLGFSGPKGMYDLGLPSGKTLFQLQAERLISLQRLGAAAGSGNPCKIPWYIMTSPLNDAATRAFFAEQEYFGLAEEDVFFFEQGTLPCLDFDGKIILEDKGRVAVAPDGNGGIYTALAKSGALADMERRGVKVVHAFAVDNALVQLADPVFVGHFLEAGLRVSNKACPKASWDERVGVFALRDGGFHVVEYSEIDEDTAKLADAAGNLVYSAGNICNHAYSLEFLRDVAAPSLGKVFHVAKKKIPFYDAEAAATVKPTENNGMKLESFIFDVLPLCDNVAQVGVFEVGREAEFSPVKNAPGSAKDCPDTARAMIFALHRRWLLDAGAVVEGDVEAACEVSSLVSVRGEGLKALSGATLRAPLYVTAAPPESGGAAPYEHSVDGRGINVYTLRARV